MSATSGVRLRVLGAVGAAILGASVACSLNPQPLPPLAAEDSGSPVNNPGDGKYDDAGRRDSGHGPNPPPADAQAGLDGSGGGGDGEVPDGGGIGDGGPDVETDAETDAGTDAEADAEAGAGPDANADGSKTSDAGAPDARAD